MSHCRSCSPRREMEFLVQTSPFKPWLIPCGIFPTYWTEMMLLSGGQVGISRAKVMKLDVQRRDCLYFQSLQLSLKVKAGEGHQGSLPVLLLGWGITKDHIPSTGEMGRWKGQCPRNVSNCRVSICKCCSSYKNVTFSWWRGSEIWRFSLTLWIAEWFPELGWDRQLSKPLSYPILKAVGPGKCCLTQHGGL